MVIERKYRTFTELVKKKGYDKDDLIYWGRKGDLPFYVLPTGGCKGRWLTLDTSDPDPFDDDGVYSIDLLPPSPCRITPHQFHKILNGMTLNELFQKADIEKGMDESGLTFCLEEGIPVRYFSFKTPVHFKEDDLVVMKTDIESLKAETAAAPTVEEDHIVWGWKNMENCYTGLTRSKIVYGAEQLDIAFQKKSDDPPNNRRIGLLKSELKMILLRKRSNAVK